MRLLRTRDDGGFDLVERVGKHIPKYAILSHTWGAEGEEVTYNDLVRGVGETKAAYRKLTFCGRQAASDGLQFFWIDTCSIDRSSSAELQEAINSMFRWYQDAAKCYVYLSDVSTDDFLTDNQSFRECRWFTRGWTLQELLAPTCVEFFSCGGDLLGDKGSLALQITEVTGIPIEAFQGTPLRQFSIGARMSWLAGRETTREEDAAYCLLGIFNVHMPLIYGEGRRNAFSRLREAIERSLQDQQSDLSLHQQLFQLPRDSGTPLSVMAYVKNPDRAEQSTIRALPQVYMDSGVSSNLSVPTLEGARPQHRIRSGGSVLSHGNDGKHIQAISRGIPGPGDVSTGTHERGTPRLHSNLKTWSEPTTNQPDFESNMNSDGEASFLKLLLDESSGEMGVTSMLQNETGLTNILQHYIESEVQISEEHFQNHFGHASVRHILRSLLSIRHARILDSQKVIRDWLDVARFEDRHDAASYYDKQVLACLEGTCQWIFTHPAYKEWAPEENHDEATRVLWICAPAGYGKTVLCAQLVEHLKGSAWSPPVYFFASSHAQAGGEPSFVIRHWIAQMARLNADVLDMVRQHSKVGHRASESILWSLLRTILSDICSFTFVLDGFDEYDRGDDARATFLQKLNRATNRTGSRILITSRIETDIEAELSLNTSKEAGYVILQCRITEDDIQADISLFSKSVVDKKLPKKDGLLRHELAERLAQKCEGMFLWIRLQQDQLRSGKNAKQLHNIVNNMPVGLHQTYERNWAAIRKLSTEDRQRALAILTWATYAFRPLTVSELIEALIVEYNDGAAVLQWDELPDEIDDEYINSEIVDICGGLLEARSETPKGSAGMRTIHLIHSSVRDFLLHTLSRGSLDVAESYLIPTQASSQAEHHQRLAAICIAYLDNEETWQRFTAKGRPGKDSGFVDYATRNWDLHTAAAGKENDGLARLLKRFFRPGNESFGLWSKYIDSHETSPDADQKGEGSEATPLYYAALFDLPEVVKYVLTQDATQLDKVGGKYGSPLQAACCKGHELTFELLLDLGADPDMVGGEFGVPLNAAINAGHQSMVKTLLDRRADHTLKDPIGRTPFYTAAKSGNCEAIHWLVAAGAEEVATNKWGWTPLNAAAAEGHSEVVQLLLERGADMTVANIDGWMPLYAAALHGHAEVVTLLLKNGADFTARTNEGWTPLHAAAEKGNPEIVRSLLEAGADLTVPNNDGATPLYTAAANGNLEVVTLLLKKGADFTIPNNGGWTPLNVTAEGGHLEVVRFLLEKGADLTIPNEHGATPFYTAARTGHLEVAQLLLEKGADFTVINKNGWTPLTSAANNGHLGVVKLLLEKNADFIVPDKDGWTPLYAAAVGGHWEVVKLLLGQNADFTIPNSHGRTPLNAAASAGHLEVVKLLLEKNADTMVPDQTGWTPLYSAALNGHLDVVELLLNSDADIAVLNNDGWTPLNAAASNGHSEVVRLLLEKGADINVQNNDGWTPLNVAASKGHLGVVKLLLKNNADSTIPSKEYWTPIVIAAFSGHLEVVDLLIKENVDFTVPTIDGWTPLFAAACGGRLDIVKLLLFEKNADFTVPNNHGWTPLFAAAFNGHLEVVKLLLNMKADVTVSNNDGWTPLLAAAFNGHLEVFKLLLDNDADFTVQTNHGWTPLNTAASKGHLQIVKLLLEKNADPTIPSNDYWTPLVVAAFGGHLEVVKLLISINLDFTASTIDGWTPLFAAACGGRLEVVKLLLLEKNADITVQNNHGWTPLFAAALNGHLEVVKLLLDKYADVTVPNKDSWTPIFAAASNGHLEVVQLLLKKDADLAVLNNDGFTPLYMAALGGHLEVVNLLLENVAGSNLPDGKGGVCDNALYAASYRGHLEVVKALLDKGSDVNAEGGEHGTALHAAVLTCSIPIVRLLLDRGADTEAKDSHGWTASMIAHKIGHREIYEMLGNPAVDQQPSWDQCMVPRTLTVAGSSTVKITGNGTVANSERLSPTELESKIQIRADHPFPMAQGFAYFEITVYDSGSNRMIGVGLCHENSPRIGMPGWRKGSWAYHGDDGKLFMERGQGTHYGETYGAGDVIGCGVDVDKDEIFFTKNGTRVGSAGRSLRGRLFAVVGVGCESFRFSVNFGPAGFRYSL